MMPGFDDYNDDNNNDDRIEEIDDDDNDDIEYHDSHDIQVLDSDDDEQGHYNGAVGGITGRRRQLRQNRHQELSSTQRRLANLFRPPFDIISVLNLDEAKYQGRQLKKWILINIQDSLEFQCQVLNRDFGLMKESNKLSNKTSYFYNTKLILLMGNRTLIFIMLILSLILLFWIH